MLFGAGSATGLYIQPQFRPMLCRRRSVLFTVHIQSAILQPPVRNRHQPSWALWYSSLAVDPSKLPVGIRAGTLRNQKHVCFLTLSGPVSSDPNCHGWTDCKNFWSFSSRLLHVYAWPRVLSPKPGHQHSYTAIKKPSTRWVSDHDGVALFYIKNVAHVVLNMPVFGRIYWQYIWW